MGCFGKCSFEDWSDRSAKLYLMFGDDVIFAKMLSYFILASQAQHLTVLSSDTPG